MHGLIRRRALIDWRKSPKQIKPDETGEDSRRVWNLEPTQRIRNAGCHLKWSWGLLMALIEVHTRCISPQWSSRSAGGRTGPRRSMWRRWLQSEGRTSTSHPHYALSAPKRERKTKQQQFDRKNTSKRITGFGKRQGTFIDITRWSSF